MIINVQYSYMAFIGYDAKVQFEKYYKKKQCIIEHLDNIGCKNTQLAYLSSLGL